MEVITRFWLRLLGRLVLMWGAFAQALYGLIEEVDFRVAPAWRIVRGRVPVRLEKRPWVRSADTPIMVDIYDWTTDRLLASVLVWPSLESSPETAAYDQRVRLEEILGAFAAGAARKRWSTYWEVDYGLQWDHDREAWVDGDGIAYDGRRLFAYSRGLGAPGECPENYPGGCLGGRGDT